MMCACMFVVCVCAVHSLASSLPNAITHRQTKAQTVSHPTILSSWPHPSFDYPIPSVHAVCWGVPRTIPFTFKSTPYTCTAFRALILGL